MKALESAPALKSRAYLQSCLGRRVGDEINDDLVADQWLAAPALCDVAEVAGSRPVSVSLSRAANENQSDTPPFQGAAFPASQALRAPGGNESMCFAKSAICHISGPDRVSPKAGIPVKRIPWATFQ